MKKVFAVVLTTLLVFSLLGCGESNKSNGSESASSGKSSSVTGSASDSTEKPSGGNESSSAENTETGKKWRVAYFNRDNTDEYCMRMANAFAARCDADPTIELTLYDAGNDTTTQLGQMEDAMSKGVDYVAFVPSDSESLLGVITSMNKANIGVISMGVQMNREAGASFDWTGSGNYDMGYNAMKYIVDHIPENGKLIILEWPPVAQMCIERSEGFDDALKESGRDDIEVIERMEYMGTQADAMAVMEDLIQKHGDDFDAVVTACDPGMYGVIGAIEGAGYDPGKKVLSCVGSNDMAYRLILAGKLDQCIAEDMEGMVDKAFELCKAWQAGEPPEYGDYQRATIPITIDNVNDFYEG